MGRRPGAELGALGRSGLAPARVPGELWCIACFFAERVVGEEHKVIWSPARVATLFTAAGLESPPRDWKLPYERVRITFSSKLGINTATSRKASQQPTPALQTRPDTGT